MNINGHKPAMHARRSVTLPRASGRQSTTSTAHLHTHAISCSNSVPRGPQLMPHLKFSPCSPKRFNHSQHFNTFTPNSTALPLPQNHSYDTSTTLPQLTVTLLQLSPSKHTYIHCSEHHNHDVSTTTTFRDQRQREDALMDGDA